MACCPFYQFRKSITSLRIVAYLQDVAVAIASRDNYKQHIDNGWWVIIERGNNLLFEKTLTTSPNPEKKIQFILTVEQWDMLYVLFYQLKEGIEILEARKAR